jgi:hypothetical protein
MGYRSFFVYTPDRQSKTGVLETIAKYNDSMNEDYLKIDNVAYGRAPNQQAIIDHGVYTDADLTDAIMFGTWEFDGLEAWQFFKQRGFQMRWYFDIIYGACGKPRTDDAVVWDAFEKAVELNQKLVQSHSRLISDTHVEVLKLRAEERNGL